MEENNKPNNEALNTNDVQYYEPSTEQTTSVANENWQWNNFIQSIQPSSSHGGSNQTSPQTKAFKKRRNKQKAQKNSRRLNRKH